eukprot:257987_1
MPSRLRTEGDCSICLNSKVSDVAAISCCKHTFHAHCIQSWSQITNKCPLCKVFFDFITILDTHQLIHVEHREQRIQNDDLYIINDTYWDCVPCQECKSTDPSNDHLAIICDSCENVYHTFCIGLGDTVPEEDNWFCPKCRAFLFPPPPDTPKEDTPIYYDDLSDFDMNEELPLDAFSKHSFNEGDDEWLPKGHRPSNNETNPDFGTIKREKKRKKHKKHRKRKQRMQWTHDEANVIRQEQDEEHIKRMRHRKRRERTDDVENHNESPFKRRRIGIRDDEDNRNTKELIDDEHNDPLDAAFYGGTMKREGIECVEDRRGNKMWRFTFTKKKKKSK